MSDDAWELSAAGTQLLLELREGRGPKAAADGLGPLAITLGELVLRGAMRIDAVRPARRRLLRREPADLIVSTRTPSRPLVGPPLALESLLGRLRRAPLLPALRVHPRLAGALRLRAEEELRLCALVERRPSRTFGLLPSSSCQPTDAGLARQAEARRRLEASDGLHALPDAELADALRQLGTLVLLRENGLALVVRAQATRQTPDVGGDGEELARILTAIEDAADRRPRGGTDIGGYIGGDAGST